MTEHSKTRLADTLRLRFTSVCVGAMFIALHMLEGLSSEAVYHTPKFDWVWTDYPFSGCDCEFHELWITPQHILTSVFVAMTVLACSAVKFPLPALFSHTRFREFFFWMPGGLAGLFRSTEQAKLHRTLVAVWIVLIINFYSLFAFIGHVLHSFGGFSIHAALSFAIPDPTPGGLGLVIALAYQSVVLRGKLVLADESGLNFRQSG